jgi:hypothetical protein
MKKYVCMLALLSCVPLAGCATDADVVSRNLSIEAGNFKIDRRIVFYNGITGQYILTITGRCQVEHGEKLAVTCKTGPDEYKKHYLGLSDNVTYFSEQLSAADVSAYRYQVVFKPDVILPDIELRSTLNK